jgi:hypothetical protein
MPENKKKIYRQDLLKILEVSNESLRRVINKNMEAMKKTGYKKFQRRFTAEQINYLHRLFWGENYL